MSISRSYYVIAGYDLTDCKTDKYDDWRWTNDGERYLCNQIKSEMQLFDDPMNSDYLYFGYILSSNDAYGFETQSFGIEEIEKQRSCVDNEIRKLNDFGVIDISKLGSQYRVIVFEECT